MTVPFSTLVATYKHAIGAEIECAQRRRLLLEHLSAMTFLTVDMTGAERVGRGGWIFPDPGTPVDWYVLANQIFEGLPRLALFSFAGVLPGNSAPEDFLTQAYLQVLRRPVDTSGRNYHGTRLASGAITRRGLLKVLANSSEAKSNGVDLMIVPETSFGLPPPDESG